MYCTTVAHDALTIFKSTALTDMVKILEVSQTLNKKELQSHILNDNFNINWKYSKFLIR